MTITPIRPSRTGYLVAIAVASLGLATIAVGVLQSSAGVPDALVVYLVAVVATAVVGGPIWAAAAAAAAALLYDFLFVQPVHTLTILAPADVLNTVLLLFTGIVVGELAALQRSRADAAQAREREARALFQVSRALATRASTTDVLPDVAHLLRDETGMQRVWISLGAQDTWERVAADTGDGVAPAVPATYAVLRRAPGSEPATWVRIHEVSRRAGQAAPGRPGGPVEPGVPTGRGGTPIPYGVRVEAGGARLGTIWGLRPRARAEPDRSATRLLSAAADQVGQALEQDRLATEAREIEIARRSDELKSALLESVSHDLRTPLASIRAAAGTLRDPEVQLSVEDQRASADAIDAEAEHLNRLVTNLLDLSRIEGGALQADRKAFELDDLVRRTVDRLRSRLAERHVTLALDAPPVDVDATFLDEIVTNMLENALKYAPAGAEIRLSARPLPGEPFVRLTVEDGGPGVPAESLPLLFDKFYRVPRRPGSPRPGTGIGLAVVRGLAEAMGARVAARASALGGLAVDIDLPAARLPELSEPSAAATEAL